MKRLLSLLLAFTVVSCSDELLDMEITPVTLNAVGTSFMNRVMSRPDWRSEWNALQAQGEPVCNEAVLAYGGKYGWHYILPLEINGTVRGLVIYPLEGVPDEEGPRKGALGSPVVLDGKAILNNLSARSFLRSPAFTRWKTNGLQIGDELYPEGLPVMPVMPRSGGCYPAAYLITFNNYVDIHNEVVVVGMTFDAIADVFEKSIDYLPFTPEILVTVERDMVYLCAESEEYAVMYYREVEMAFWRLHCTIIFFPYWDDANIGWGGGGSTGGGTPGGGGGGGLPEEPAVDTPLTDLIYDGNSTLTPHQKSLLEAAIEKIKEKCPEFAELFELLKNTPLIFKIDPTKTALACYTDGTICFADESTIAVQYLLEEFIHAVQDLTLYGSDQMHISYKNVEFEAKVFQDVVLWQQGWGGAMLGSYGADDAFITDYDGWIINGSDNKALLIDRFNDFCNQWTGYGGRYNPNFAPLLIENLLK